MHIDDLCQHMSKWQQFKGIAASRALPCNVNMFPYHRLVVKGKKSSWFIIYVDDVECSVNLCDNIDE